MKLSPITRLKKALFKAYAKNLCLAFEKQTASCREIQDRVLLAKLRRNQDTVFGQKHNFKQIHFSQDYFHNVPLHDYEDLEPYIDRIKRGEKNILTTAKDPIEMFALSSGTTADPKFIPVTESFRKEYHHGSLMWAARLFYQLEDFFERGKILQISSPAKQDQLPSGLWCGNISGAIAEMQKPIVKQFYAMPKEVARITPAADRFYTMMRIALTQRVGILITANPSLILNLVEMVDKQRDTLISDICHGQLSIKAELTPNIKTALKPYLKPNPERAKELTEMITKRGSLLPRDYWPELVAIACWTGGTLVNYIEQLPDYFGDIPIREIGLMASEGRFTIPWDDAPATGILDILSHFFEFIPEDEADHEKPKTLLAHEIEKGKRYFLVVTTSSGLYRYKMHDLVEVTDFYHGTPMVKFLSKGSRFASITGEKISEFQIVKAIQEANHVTGKHITWFRLFPSWDNPPYYNLMIERNDAEKIRAVADQFVEVCENTLQGVNIEYQSKRHSRRLGHIRLRVVENGIFSAEKEKKLKKSGSEEQYKPLYLSSDLQMAERYHFLEEFHNLAVSKS